MFTREGLSAAFAGFAQVVCFMWLRTVLNVQYANGGSFIKTVSLLWSEGGIVRFYRGFFFAIVQNPLARYGDVAANTAGLKFLGGSNMNLFITTAVSSLCASLWRLFLTPIDYLKTSLQVHGQNGLHIVRERCSKMGARILWTGGFAILITNWASTYAWFTTHNFLELHLPSVGSKTFHSNVRQALIGFSSSLLSDSCTNCIRVVKTVTQTRSNMNYFASIRLVHREGGLSDVMGRGLKTRLLTNAIQSSFFTVVWKLVEARSSVEQQSSGNDWFPIVSDEPQSSGNEWLPIVCYASSSSTKPCSSEISSVKIKCPNSMKPLHELSKGNVPAIIIRTVLTKEEVKFLLQDAEKLRHIGKISLRRSLKRDTQKEFLETLNKASVRERELLLSDLRSFCGVQKMRFALNILASRESKTLNISYTTEKMLFPSVAVRENPANSGFLPAHFDSLHSFKWDKRACKKQKKSTETEKISSYVKILPTYTYDHLLGMVLSLRAGSESADMDNVVKLYKANIDNLINMCSVEGRSHGIGVNLHYFSQWADKNQIHSYQLNMSTGDMYVFNANYVHEVQRTIGKLSRMTMASFLSYDVSESSILPWI